MLRIAPAVAAYLRSELQHPKCRLCRQVFAFAFFAALCDAALDEARGIRFGGAGAVCNSNPRKTWPKVDAHLTPLTRFHKILIPYNILSTSEFHKQRNQTPSISTSSSPGGGQGCSKDKMAPLPPGAYNCLPNASSGSTMSALDKAKETIQQVGHRADERATGEWKRAETSQTLMRGRPSHHCHSLAQCQRGTSRISRGDEKMYIQSAPCMHRSAPADLTGAPAASHLLHPPSASNTPS
jgi:hypothetical protein